MRNRDRDLPPPTDAHGNPVIITAADRRNSRRIGAWVSRIKQAMASQPTASDISLSQQTDDADGFWQNPDLFLEKGLNADSESCTPVIIPNNKPGEN